jgi:Family of unknown function (DUF6281)
MNDLRDLLEAERQRFRMPDGSFAALERLRERKRRLQSVTVGLAAILVAGLGASVYAIGRSGSTHQEGPAAQSECGYVVTFQGRGYTNLVVAVAPPEGVRLGEATQRGGCSDTGQSSPPHTSTFAVASFPGLPSSVALVIPGNDEFVLVRKGLGQLPPAVSALIHAPSCRASDEPIRLSGTWLGILGANGKTELDLVPPYDVFIRVTSSSSSRYERARLTVRVPASLGHPISHQDVVNSLWRGGSISITAGCDGTGFLASDVSVPPPNG